MTRYKCTLCGQLKKGHTCPDVFGAGIKKAIDKSQDRIDLKAKLLARMRDTNPDVPQDPPSDEELPLFEAEDAAEVVSILASEDNLFDVALQVEGGDLASALPIFDGDVAHAAESDDQGELDAAFWESVL